MRIIDKLTGRLFDVPSDFNISFEKSNPFLTDQGTISLPCTFPYTDNNVQILDNPLRYDRAIKLTIKRKVIIQAGIYQREATLALTGGKKPTPFASGYINGTFLIDESVFYNQMKDITMQSVFSGIIRDDFTGTREAKINLWVDYMEKVMSNRVQDDFHIFPVCYETTVPETINGFLNHVTSQHRYEDFTVTPNLIYLNLSGKYARTFRIDDADVLIPIGYEITPFLKLSYILNTLFTSFGYTLNQDYLTKYPDLVKEVCLNNTADALMLGYLDYGQLVPTKTINEYLNSIRYKYGCEFFLAENGVDVKLVFWNDVLEEVDIDVSKLVQDSPVCTFEAPKTIQLTGSYSNVITTLKFKNFYDMMRSFDFPTLTTGIIPVSEDPDIFNQLFFSQVNLQYYHYWKKAGSFGNYDFIGESLSDYYNTDNIEAKTFSNPWEAVPMMYVHMSKTKDKLSLWDPVLELYPQSIPYIGAVRTLNTTLFVKSATKQNTQVECPIMSCFHVGKRVYTNNEENDQNTFMYHGSTYRFHDDGTPWGTLNLVYNGLNGLFETFWKKFDMVLRNSWQPIVLPINLSITQAFHWDPSKQKLLNGQSMICEVLKYELSDAGIVVTEADFRTTKLYTN